MKKLLILIGLIFSVNVSAITIESGEVYVFEFNSLSPWSYGSSSIPLTVSLNYATDIFGVSESMHLAFYEDDLDDVPFFSDTLATGPINSVNRTYRQFSTVHWADLQGAIRLRMGTGSVFLDSIDIQVTNPYNSSDSHRQSFDVSRIPIPIPTTAWLFSIGLAGLGWSRRKKA